MNKGSEIKRFTFRLDNSLFEKIKEIAKNSKRAIGKQMEFMLEQQLKNNK